MSKLEAMALFQAEWSFDSIPVTIPSVSDATSMLSDGGYNAMSSQLPLPTDAMPQSLELPEEVWMQILGLLNDKADLLHLSLASKRMQALATRPLYEHFDLVLAPEMEESISRVLSTRNAGREFIRELTLSLDIDHDSDPKGSYHFSGILLENLPLDKLSHFRSTSHRPLSQTLFKRLLQTQKNLQHLEILPSGAIDEHYDPNTEDSCMTITDILRCASLVKLHSVRVVPDMPQTAALCSIALQKGNSQAVTSLEVDARHWVDAAHFPHAEDSMATKDQLVESLFAHLPRASPGHDGPFDSLTTLVLKDVKLAVSKYTWFTYLSLSKLQRLELRHCKDADIFLLQLISGPHVPALKAFTMVHDVGEHTHDRSILGIEQLLQDTGNSIVELELCLRNAPKLPKITSITRHGGSLRRLTLDIGSSMGSWHITSGRLVYAEDEFQDLLVACVQLRQLAIALPEVSLEYSTLLAKSPEFALFITSVAMSFKLEVLSLLSLPSDYRCIQPSGYYAAKDMALRRLAVDIFAIHRSHSASLQVIAFGTRERADNHLGPRFFVPSEVRLRNETYADAARVSFADLQKDGLAEGVIGYERRDFDAPSRRLFHPVEKEGQEWQGQEDAWQADSW